MTYGGENYLIEKNETSPPCGGLVLGCDTLAVHDLNCKMCVLYLI